MPDDGLLTPRRSIRNNFVLIYELLDEVLDYGFPQNWCEPSLSWPPLWWAAAGCASAGVEHTYATGMRRSVAGAPLERR